MPVVSRKHRSRFRTSPSLLFLALVALIAFYFAGPIVLERCLVVKSPVKKVDAIVVMAGARHERLPTAAELYRQGVAPKILLANDGVKGPWSDKYQKNLYLVEWARESLMQMGVPEDAIVLLDFTKSGSFYDALNTRNYVLADSHPAVRSLLVVTSFYHTRRSLWAFNHVFAGTGVTVGVCPAPKPSGYKGRYLLIMSEEVVKLAYYHVRYGLFSAQ